MNQPDSLPLELFYIEVPNGSLTSRLVRLIPGDNIQVATRAHGFMILDEVPSGKVSMADGHWHWCRAFSLDSND